VKLKQDQTSIVFIGSFNPRLFHPAWMESHGVLTKKEAEDVLEDKQKQEGGESKNDAPTNLIVSEPLAQITAMGLQITVEQSRLIITAMTQDRHTRCFEIAVALQKLIPHSPTTAIGLNRNFVLEAQSQVAWHKIGHTIIPKDVFWKENGQDPGTMNATVKYPRCKVERAQLNLTIGPVLETREYLVHVNCNYHFDRQSLAANDAGQASASEVSTPKGGLRMINFQSLLTEQQWSAVSEDAFAIAERVAELGNS
jgi:hypothetical protein